MSVNGFEIYYCLLNQLLQNEENGIRVCSNLYPRNLFRPDSYLGIGRGMGSN